MSQHRDHLVGDALRRLDVPDHGPDFWAALESRLAEADPTDGADAGRDEPADGEDDVAEVVELGSARSTRRRQTGRSKRLPVVAAAAAAAAAIALGVGLPAVQQAADGESQVDMADQTPDPSAPVATDPVPTAPAPAARTAAEAEAEAAAWLDRLFAGDLDGAYGMLDDPSTERMSRDDFDLLGSGLFEGAAAFAQDGISRTVTSYAAAGPFHVVTFSGEVEREGMVETASYPVVVTETGIHFVIAEAPQLEIDPEYADGSGTTLASPLVMQVGEATDAWVWVDGDAPQRLTERGRVAIDVESLAGAGTHLVLVVAAEGDLITARAHTVVVP